MAKKIKNPEIIFDFANEEDLDICGFSDAPIKGKCIATFSCSNNNSNSEIKEEAPEQLNDHDNSIAKSLPVNSNASNSSDQVTNNAAKTVIPTTIEQYSKSEFNNPVAANNTNKSSSN